MMDPKLKAAWIADLEKESNQGKQTTGKLSANRQFCCLGRLCVVAGLKSKAVDSTGRHRSYDGEEGELTPRLQEKFGIPDTLAGHLIELNDTKKQTFKQIAEFIKASPDL